MRNMLLAGLMLLVLGCEIRARTYAPTPTITVTHYDYYDYCAGSGGCCYYYEYYDAPYPWYEVCEVMECYDSWTEDYEYIEETCWYE